jgi:acetylornithine deacetylase/succinyl-diaminopimelate desuccinylase-like protein
MDLKAYIDQAKVDLTKLVALESVSAQGRMLTETAAFVTALLEAEGFTVRSYPGQAAPILVAQAGDGPRTMLIYNHYDVQPESPTDLWKSPPFALTERAEADGVPRWFARGVSDDKGELISRLAGLRALKAQNGGKLPLKIKWLIEGEEEIGSPSLEHFVTEHAAELQADGCWWEFGSIDPEGRPTLYAGLKGIICLELRCKTADSDLHSANGAVVDNPLWRLAKAVASMRDENGRVTMDGFYDQVRKPSATDLEYVSQIPDESKALQKAYGIKGFFENASGARFYQRADLEPALNVNGFHGGYGDAGSKTVLPCEGFVKLDFRLVPDQKPKHVAQLVRAHLDKIGLGDIDVIELETHENPARSDLNHPFMKLAIDTARDVYGKEPVVHPSAGGSGPMHPFVESVGVPVVAVGIGNIQGFVHAPNENIVIEHFEKGVAYALEFFKRVARM